MIANEPAVKTATRLLRRQYRQRHLDQRSRRQLPPAVLRADRLRARRPGQQQGAGHPGARGRREQPESARQHVEQPQLGEVRRGVQLRRPTARARSRRRARSRPRNRTTSSSSWKASEGQQDLGVQLALYFQRVAPTVSLAYGMLGDENLLDAFRPSSALRPRPTANIDAKASIISQLMPMSELHGSDQAQAADRTLHRRVHARLRTGRSRRLDAADHYLGRQRRRPSCAATTILSNLISGNSSYSGSRPPSCCRAALLTGLQNLSLGG